MACAMQHPCGLTVWIVRPESRSVVGSPVRKVADPDTQFHGIAPLVATAAATQSAIIFHGFFFYFIYVPIYNLLNAVSNK
jgi:hypothetical protein